MTLNLENYELTKEEINELKDALFHFCVRVAESEDASGEELAILPRMIMLLTGYAPFSS